LTEGKTKKAAVSYQFSIVSLSLSKAFLNRNRFRQAQPDNNW